MCDLRARSLCASAEMCERMRTQDFCYKNVERPLEATVSNEDRKDTDMKLLLIFAAILAFSLAEEEKKKEEHIEDSEAEASGNVELLRSGTDLNTAASSYNSYVPPSQRPNQWNQNYGQQNSWPQEPVKPIQPVYTGVQNDYYGNQHYHPQPQWTTPVYYPPSTTTPVSVIKNEQYFGDNGYYKYEYQIADGTHVGEEGYYTDPKQTDESLVKKGWYSYLGADGKTYTVKYWADHTGYHAFGDHLPTPPPVPAAIQAALDKEKEAEKYKPQNDYPTQTPAPVYYPTQAPINKPWPHPIYVPVQPTYQSTYKPPVQSTYQPPQVPSYNPQQTYYPKPQQYYPYQQYNYPQNSNNYS